MFARLRELSPAFKKSKNKLYERLLGFGSEYATQVQKDYNLAIAQLGVIVKASGIKRAISETGMAAVKTEVIRKAKGLDVNAILLALSSNHHWIDARLPLKTICKQALRKNVCFDALLEGIHKMRDTMILPNNVVVLGDLLHRWVIGV